MNGEILVYRELRATQDDRLAGESGVKVYGLRRRHIGDRLPQGTRNGIHGEISAVVGVDRAIPGVCVVPRVNQEQSPRCPGDSSHRKTKIPAQQPGIVIHCRHFKRVGQRIPRRTLVGNESGIDLDLRKRRARALLNPIEQECPVHWGDHQRERDGAAARHFEHLHGNRERSPPGIRDARVGD